MNITVNAIDEERGRRISIAIAPPNSGHAVWDATALMHRIITPRVPIWICGNDPFDQALKIGLFALRLKRDPRYTGPITVMTKYTFAAIADWVALDQASTVAIGARMMLDYGADFLVDGTHRCTDLRKVRQGKQEWVEVGA